MKISQKYLEFINLVQALNTIVFGDDTAEVTLDGITKPSISKFLAQVDALTTAELQRLRDAIDVVMNQQSVPTTIVTDGTHSQEWINSDFRAALQALNDWIDTKGLPNGYASLDANGIIPEEQLPINAINQATETELGVAKIATSAIAQAGINDTDFITAKKLKSITDALPLFTSAQNVLDVTASRTSGTIYTNVGKPKFIAIDVNNSSTGDSVLFQKDNAGNWIGMGVRGSGTRTVYALVLPLRQYKYESPTTFAKWVETVL